MERSKELWVRSWQGCNRISHWSWECSSPLELPSVSNKSSSSSSSSITSCRISRRDRFLLLMIVPSMTKHGLEPECDAHVEFSHGEREDAEVPLYTSFMVAVDGYSSNSVWLFRFFWKLFLWKDCWASKKKKLKTNHTCYCSSHAWTSDVIILSDSCFLPVRNSEFCSLLLKSRLITA